LGLASVACRVREAHCIIRRRRQRDKYRHLGRLDTIDSSVEIIDFDRLSLLWLVKYTMRDSDP
jgi:hypothetical protein